MTEQRNFDNEFWEIVTHMAGLDHLLGRWATLAAQSREDLDFIDLPEGAQAYINQNYGLNLERAEQAFAIAKDLQDKQVRQRHQGITGHG